VREAGLAHVAQRHQASGDAHVDFGRELFSALRGVGDTRTPMFCHFLAYWVIGLPLGAWLCFGRGWGAAGLWSGLSLALILIGVVLWFVWRRAVQRLSAPDVA